MYHHDLTWRARFNCRVGMIVALVVSGGIPSPAFADSRPNVLLIVVDDLGYGELGCQGNPQIPTPHIDSLATNGVRFTSGYVTASYCSPSRAGMMAGRYQTRFGYELNPVGKSNLHPKAGLPTSETTIASRLKEAGYATALIGKWHLGGTEPYHPQNRGFENFYGFLHEGHFFVPPPYSEVISFLRLKTLPDPTKTRWSKGNITYTSHMGTNEPPYDEHNPILRGRQELVEPEYFTNALTREAIDYIKAPREKPFFLYLAYNAVHSPLQARPEDMKPFEALDLHRRVFAGMLSNLDENIGRILRTLKEQQLDENTFIIFVSDNGGPTKELTSSNKPLRGGKGNLYEGGIRVPFLMQWKNRLPKGTVYEHPVIATDIYATVLNAAGKTEGIKNIPESVNLLPYLTGENTDRPHDILYWRMQQKTALRKGDWKIVRNPPRGGKTTAFELYDLKADLSESENLAGKNIEKLNELKIDWQRLDEQMIAPVWRPNMK